MWSITQNMWATFMINWHHMQNKQLDKATLTEGCFWPSSKVFVATQWFSQVLQYQALTESVPGAFLSVKM